MVGRNIGISQQTLVSNNGALGTKGDRTFQYIAGLASTLGALAAGMVLAWTSPAGKDGIRLKDAGYDFPISEEEFSWIGSLTPLGAAAICVPIGILTDLIGRKKAMLVLVVPFTIGWICVIFAKSVLMMYIGRFILGLSGGAFCVTAPMYTAEIAENEIRGSLGSYFQLLLNCGILMTYILGTFLNMFTLSIVSAMVPLIFFVVFSFMPETPIYYLKTGEENAARTSLKKLRGSQYNVEMELQNLQESMMRAESTNESFSTAIRSKAAIKGLVIAFGLMFFQQLSGINAIIFYAGDIFKAANKDSDPNVSTIIVGVMQTVAVFVSTLIVDRAGRKLLLVSSSAVMFITTLVLGIYFKLNESGSDVQSIGWLPLVCVCVFAILFAIGFGPIPWMMMGEIFAPSIKGVAASSACLFNWLMAFVVTKFFSNVRGVIHDSGTFWLFSVVCLVGVFFVIFVTPETKGKSLEEIQEELGN